jgi:predicted secreted protein
MKRRLAVVVGLLTLAVGLSGCWFAPVTIAVEDDGSIRAAHLGDRIDVRLEGNPSTGHEWIRLEPADMTGTPLEPVDEGACVGTREELVGGPVDYVFRYRAVAPGTVVLTYVYKAPWEAEPLETFSVVVWVRE